jgi:hypothetical protein
MIIINFCSGVLFVLFYYPPTREEKFGDRSAMQQLKEFDFIGTILFVAGFLIVSSILLQEDLYAY